jgi:GT2 family glycosyltransferase
MAKIKAVFVIPVIQKAYIFDCLRTLFENTPINFRTIVVDNTKLGLHADPELWAKTKPMIDLYLAANRNLGFAKSMDEGIIHGLHWGADYVVACNDDVEFVDPRWWQGIIDQFERYPEMLAVNPASVIEPGWGYGIENRDAFVCPDWGVVVGEDIYPKGPDGQPITYEMAKTKEGYDQLMAHRGGHIEGFAGWCVVGKRELWQRVGLYDERFTPGGGEDYELCHRIYLAGGRASATLGSFVWHWWGKSKEIVHTSEEPMETKRGTFQDTNALFTFSKKGANSPIFPPRENEPLGNLRKRKSAGILVDDIR